VTLPAPLAELVDDFADVTPKERLQLLLELSEELPALPERYADAADTMEQVHECQSPLFLAVEVEDAGEQAVHLFFSAPREAPTTRGFASIGSPPPTCWPCRTTSTSRWGWGRPSARCGCAASRPCSPASRAR
jgi:Fe-S metabolism associated domain